MTRYTDNPTLSFALRPWPVLLAIGLLYVTFLFPSPEYNNYNKDDASWFLTLGFNLAEQGRYTTDTFPIENYGRHATWPFVFPALLAAVVSIVGISWVALKLMMVALGLANLYLLQQLWVGRSVGLWAVALTGLGPAYFLFSHVTMTEIPYMVAVTATLLAMERTQTVRGGLAAGLLACLAFFTRGYAVVFVPAGMCFYMLQRSWPMRKRVTIAACFVTPIVIGVVAWSAYTSQIVASGNLDWITSEFGTGVSIISQWHRPLGQYARDFYWFHFRSTLHLMLPIFSQNMLDNDLLAFFGMGLLVIAGLGWLLSIRERPGALELWLPFAIGLHISAGSISPRYWITFVPFLFYYFLLAFKEFANRFPKVQWLYPSVTACFLIVAVFSLSVHLANPDRLRFLNSYWHDYRELAVWARHSLPENAIIVAHHPHNFYVAANRRAYRMEDVNPEAWPPEVLATETPIYVLHPHPVQEDKKLSAAISISEQLLGASRFEKVHQEGQVALYIDTGPK